MPQTTPNAAPNVQAPHDAARDWADLSGRWGHRHSAPAELIAPGPTLAEVLAELHDTRRELAALRATLGIAL